MLNNASEEFKKYFLLEFTKQLIKNSSNEPFIELQKEIEYTSKERKQKVKNILKRRKFSQELNLEYPLQRISMQKRRPILKNKSRVLRIPEPKIPPNLNYLKPSAKKLELDLGKLNSLIKNPTINNIECNGANENILADNQKTNVTLTEFEIGYIIKKFSEAGKTPIHDGIFKVTAGNLIITAIISETLGSRFIIKKLKFNPFRR